jgi:hypothetical protein
MSVQPDAAGLLAGEYVATGYGYGDGLDYYLTVTGPDGRASRQKVYWTWAKTAHQVAEEAVVGHLGGLGSLHRTAPTRDAQDGYIVTMG